MDSLQTPGPHRPLFPLRWLRIAALSVAALLAACGGGDEGTEEELSPPPVLGVFAPVSPRLTGNTATDALNEFNFRRQQAGLPALARNSSLDVAAQMHAIYQQANGLTTHVQEAGRPGFSGERVADRIAEANYRFAERSGEVVAAHATANGSEIAQALLASVHDRFTLLEPMFMEIGVGSAASGGGASWFAAVLAALPRVHGPSTGAVAVYPFAGQAGVPVGVDSDSQVPDPVPGRNRVGYPITVHANALSRLTVQGFSLTPRGGAELAVRRLSRADDALTPASAAAIVPLSPLSPATTYDVQFTGTVDGFAVQRNWSFSTQ
jgi:uncharacterized protein YkwD